jgi:exodeoxyribonuclease V alpha subunit
MTTDQQANVAEMKIWGPERAEGVRKYIERIGRGQGVGYGRAKRFIEFFGHEKLPDIIRSRPQTLLQAVPKLDYRAFSAKWNEKTPEEHEAMMSLLSFRNIGFADAANICARYGFERATAVVHEDPYQLSFDVDGIGFEKADKIAIEGGVQRSAPKRVRAALFHALHLATEEGDSYVTRRDWISKAEYLIDRGHHKQLAEMIEQLIEDGHVHEVLLPGKPKIKSSCVYYPSSHYRVEARLASQLKKLASAPVAPLPDVQAHVARYERDQDITLSDKQRDAVTILTSKPVIVITGGPGTGKTATVRAIVQIFGEDYKLPMSLAAFAGCAAKRLREASGADALTIHKTLEYDPNSGRFIKNASDPLDAQLVILDETSMIDVSLLDSATQAVPIGSRLVLIGDVDQLPSIGPGAALRDIVASGIVPVIRLDHIFRQSKKSRIVTNAKRIKEGKTPVPAVRINEQMDVIERLPDPDLERTDDAEPLRDYIDLEIRKPAPGTNATNTTKTTTKTDDEGEPTFDIGSATCDVVVQLVKTIEKKYGIPAQEIQILSPMRVKSAGTDELNKALQAALNPFPNVTPELLDVSKPKEQLAFPEKFPWTSFAKTETKPEAKKNLQIGSNPRETVNRGDKVMQTKNDYRKLVFNGDIGFIVSVDHKRVVVDFKDDVVVEDSTLGYSLAPGHRSYNPADCQYLKLAYASTVHKSQGSEYACVIVVVMSSQSHMFSRNGYSLFYTAVTRGKKLVFVVHDQGAIEKALREPWPRQTLLAERLRGTPIQFRTGKLPAKPPTEQTDKR